MNTVRTIVIHRPDGTTQRFDVAVLANEIAKIGGGADDVIAGMKRTFRRSGWPYWFDGNSLVTWANGRKGGSHE